MYTRGADVAEPRAMLAGGGSEAVRCLVAGTTISRLDYSGPTPIYMALLRKTVRMQEFRNLTCRAGNAWLAAFFGGVRPTPLSVVFCDQVGIPPCTRFLRF
jgi:hypothetical protein